MREHLECATCHKLMIKRLSTEIDLVIDKRPAKEVSVAEPKKESEEVDEILAQLENMGRK